MNLRKSVIVADDTFQAPLTNATVDSTTYSGTKSLKFDKSLFK